MVTPPVLPGLPLGPPRALPPPGPPPPPRPDRTKWLLVALVALTGGLVGALLGVSLADRTTSPRSAAVPIVRPSDQVAGAVLDVGGVVDKVQPSVVNVTVQGSNGTGVGTGVILSADGEVVTNAHVVGDADRVKVRLVGETEPRDASVVATDARNDLALLKIDGASSLVPVAVAGAGEIQVGDDVIALGYALDLDGGPSVTRGIVSALDRTLSVDDDILDGLIQTDAAISSGNSGGPLVNNRGELVGINTAVARDGPDFSANNIGFAISVSEALPVLAAMRAGDEALQPYLGVRIGQREDGGGGALITEVVADGPADQAGVEVGDVVVGVDGRVVNGAGGLIAAIRDAAPGDVLELEVERNGVLETLRATLVEREGD